MNCPNCDTELSSVHAARSVELQQAWGGTEWIEKYVLMSSVSCPHCRAVLPDKFVEELGITGY